MQQTGQRLVELYHRATVDSGRYENVERKRFLLHLLDKLKSHRDVLNAPIPTFDPKEPWALFANRRAAHQGREMTSTFSFIVDELQSRVGMRALSETLYRCSNEVGLAIARRLSTPRATSSLRLAALRVKTDDTTHDQELSSSLLSIGECARYDQILPTNCKDLNIAIGIDNCGDTTAHFPCVEVRVQVQTQRNGSLRSSHVCTFGSLLRVDAKRRSWIALRGIDILQELRSELSPGEDVYAIRLLLTRK